MATAAMGAVKTEWVSWPSLVYWCKQQEPVKWPDLLRNLYLVYAEGEDSALDGVYLAEGWRDGVAQ